MTNKSTPKRIRLFRSEVKTPLGLFLMFSDDKDELHVAGFEDGCKNTAKAMRSFAKDEAVLLEKSVGDNPWQRAAHAYFSGDLDAFQAGVVVDNGTAFQREVWAALRTIPVGQTWTYGALADFISRPRAVRAVGLANGANPFGVVVPCHRVIGANGTLTGYAGGLTRKRWLLQHEGCSLRQRPETLDLFSR